MRVAPQREKPMSRGDIRADRLLGIEVCTVRHEAAAAMRRHWWYRGRRAAVGSLLRRAGAARGGPVLDYGCGTGHMGATLARYGPVYGFDADETALAAGRYDDYVRVASDSVEELSRVSGESTARGEDRGVAGAEPSRARGAGDGFAVIACLDVLEHVPDDVGLLRALVRRLTPGGLLVLSVPLRPELFCEIDERAGHVRRYSPATLRRLIRASGCRVVVASGYVVAALPLAVAHRRRILAGRPAADEFAVPSMPVNLAMSAVACAEGVLMRRLSLPPGLSVIVVVRAAAEGGSRGVSLGGPAADAACPEAVV